MDVPPPTPALLGPTEIRSLAGRLGLRPTKSLGQNFVVDANTVRRIVRIAEVSGDDVVLEVGPGLGSLTLGLLATGADVIAVEIDPVLAAQLPVTVADRHPAARLQVLTLDALHLSADDARFTRPDGQTVAPTALVANLPYNVAVPVLLTALARLDSLREALVMVQAEVADRLAARPGSRVYGAPSVKAGWFGEVATAGDIARSVFWPVPNVDSKLVRVRRVTPSPYLDAGVTREQVFAVVDAAFAQRRKTLRAALAGWAGSAVLAEEALRAAGVDPSTRGEQLGVAEYVAIARCRPPS